jgi:hypothetical protein
MSARPIWRRLPAVAVGLWVLSLGLLTALLVLDKANRADPRLPAWLHPGFVGDLPSALWLGAFTTVGALVAAKRPRNPIGWLLLAFGLHFIVFSTAGAYASWGLVVHPGRVPAVPAAAWIANAGFLLTFPLLIVLLVLFPDGRLPSRRWRWLLWLLAASTVARMLGEWFAAGELAWWKPMQPSDVPFPVPVDNPLGFLRIAGTPLEGIISGVATLTLALLPVALLPLLFRFRRSRGVERQQLKWLALGACVAAAGFAIGSTLWSLLQQVTKDPGNVQIIPLIALPVTMAIAVLRYRLWDIDRLLNRTLVYAIVTVVLGAAYALTVLGLAALAGGHGSNLVVAGTTLAAAAAFGPLRRRVQTSVDRRFNRRRYDAARTIEAFAARLRDQVDLQALTGELLTVVDTTMQPTSASLWLRPGSRRAVL